MLAAVAALFSALLYAVASVLQHRAALAQPTEHALRLGLLVRLATRPLWLLGVVADLAGFACQFFALGHGSLVLVQPMLTSGLLFALPLGGWVAGVRLSLADWLGALELVGGLSLFLVIAHPGLGRPDAGALAWTGAIVVVVLTTGALVVLAGGRRPAAGGEPPPAGGTGTGTDGVRPPRRAGLVAGGARRRATLLAGSAGVVYGLSAAFTKTVAHRLDAGVAPVLGAWQTYALVVASVIGMVLAQSAFQAGPLDASLPMLTAVDPVVSILFGALVFGENIDTGWLRLVVEAVGISVMVLGVFSVGRSRAVLAMHADAGDQPAARTRPRGTD